MDRNYSVSKIESKWRNEFKTCPLVEGGVFNPDLARKLFNGDPQNSDTKFKVGFCSFHDNFDFSEVDSGIKILVDYLNYIGIQVSKKSIDKCVECGQYTYNQILKKAFFIFKHLASYDEDLNINDPYYDNNGDLYFFLRIEEGKYDEPKQLTIFEELELPDLYNKYIELPEGYVEDPVTKELFNAIENSNKSFFITGKAGTGKSTFIRYFTKTTNKKVLLLAFTGIAAVNIGGQTLHSFFRFPIKPLLPNDPDIIKFKPFQQKRRIIEAVDTIIIDEVSMLRSDLLEALDYSLRINGGDPHKLFGGKQLIFVGDVFQLPPVTDSSDEVERELFNVIDESQYFFDSLAFKELEPETFEFSVVHRQADKQFISLLDEVRICKIDQNGINNLNKQYNPQYSPSPDSFVITLTTNNYLARQENAKKLSNLPYSSHFFKATITGDFREDKYPTDPILEIKRNSQIILVKNDSELNGRRWVNGTIAKVEFIDGERIEIKLKDGSIYVLQKEIWENRKYQWDNNKKRITSKVIGTYEQYPIKLAWAITIHKSQGLTFDNVIIDLGSGAFINGQLYTALSRCRTMEGIILRKRIKQSDIIIDKRLADFYRNNFDNIKTIDINFLLEHKAFFINLFSTHYPFKEDQLLRYKEKLVFGMQYNGPYEGVPFECLGLIYNKNVNWTQALRNAYYRPSELLYVNGSHDVWSAETNFNKYPILFDDIIDNYIHFVVDGALNSWDGTEDEFITWSDNFINKCSVLKVKLSPSYNFTRDELIRVVISFNTLIASSDAYYQQLMALIDCNIEGFSVEKFLKDLDWFK